MTIILLAHTDSLKKRLANVNQAIDLIFANYSQYNVIIVIFS